MVFPVNLLPVLLLHPILFAGVTAQTCSPKSRYTQPNFILKDHVNKRIPGVESSDACIEKCKEHGNCHSINYYEASSVCEVNDANHVSSPECLAPSTDGGEYQNYHERPSDTCSAKLCSDKHLCAIDDDKDNLYRCCSPAEIALHFPRVSTDDYLVVEKPFSGNLTSITISLWVKMANKTISHPGYSNVLISYNLKNTNNEILVEILTDKLYFSLHGFRSSLSDYDPVPTNYFDDKWHHFCLTWSGSSQKRAFYVDSTQIFQIDWADPKYVFEGGALVIGLDQDGYIAEFDPKETFTGYITKVNMWDRAFTSSEVKNLYNACAVGEEGNTIKWSDLYTQKKFGEVALVCVNSCG